MNRLTLKIIVAAIVALLVAVFVIAIWPTADSPQANPPDRQQSSETVRTEIAGEGVHPAERKARAERLDSGQLQLGRDSALATMDPAKVLEALEATFGGDNPDAAFSSTEEVVRQLLAQRIAGGELRLPPSGTALAADPRKATRVGPTRAAPQQTTGGSTLVESTYLGRRTQGSESAGTSERGLAPGMRSVTNTRRRGLRPTGNTDIRLAPAKPKHIEIRPAEVEPAIPKGLKNSETVDANAAK